MIDYIIIEKYQPYYDKTVLNFSDRVNTIIGDTGSGKSSIVRAFQAVFENDKSTPKFKSKLCKKGESFKITAKVDGHIIVRERSENKNIYELDGNIMPAGFGQGVPEKIKKILRLEDINKKFQFKDNFLISDSPSDIARYFNRLVNLEVIDRSFSNINKKKLKNNQDKDRLEKALEENNEKLEKYKSLPEIEKKLIEIENLSKNISENENLFIGITDKIEKIDAINSEMSKLPDIKEAKDKLKNITNLSVSITQQIEQINEAKFFIGKALSIKEEIDKLPSESIMDKAFKDLKDIKFLLNKLIDNKNLLESYIDLTSHALAIDIRLDEIPDLKGVGRSITKLKMGIEKFYKDIKFLLNKSIDNKNLLESYTDLTSHALTIDAKLDEIPDLKGVGRSITKLKMGIEKFYEDIDIKESLMKNINKAEEIILERKDIDEGLGEIKDELSKLPRCEKCGQVLIGSLDKCL